MQFLATMSQQELGFRNQDSDCDSLNPESRPLNPPPKPPAATRPVPEATGDSPGQCAESDGSLLDLYQTTMRARRMRSAGAAAIAEHESSMRAFDAFCSVRNRTLSDAGKNLRFSTPKAFLSDPDILCTFSAHLLTECSLSATTVSKRLTHVCMIAKSIGITLEKPTPNEVKRLQRELPSDLKSQISNLKSEADRRIPSFEEIDRLARHVSGLTYPYGAHAPYFWRGWIRFLAFIGPRSRDVVSVLPRKPGLRKQDVIFDTLCPIADVNNALGYPLHSPHGWMWYTIGKDQHSDCRRILFPMPKWMRDWVRFFIEFSPHAERIFPSQQANSKALSQKQMTREWNALTAAANVDPRLVPSEGTGGRIALRKFSANWWALATLRHKGDSALADKISHYVLHHAEVTTATKHYLSVQAAVLPVMLELIDQWPVPAADAPHVSLLPE